MLTHRNVILFAIAFAATALAGCAAQAAPPAKGPPPVSVTTAKVIRGSISTYATFDGAVTPVYQTTLSTAQAGTVESVNVTEGDFVSKGQLLASLDASQLKATLKANQATVRQDEAQLEHSTVAAPIASQQYSSAVSTARQNLAAAQNGVRTARAALTSNDLTQKADRELLSQGYVSRQASEQARAASISASETLRSSRQAVTAQQSSLRTALINTDQRRGDQATIAGNAAGLDGARANVELLQAQIAQSSIVAPIGADAATVESAVTNPLEEQINGVQGLKYMSSVSSNAGISTITLTFDPARNVDAAAVDVQNRVQNASGVLPAAVTQTGVRIVKSSGGFVMAIGFTSLDPNVTPLVLSNFLDRNVKDPLLRVNGVSTVQIFGERRYAMRIWLDPHKLQFYGLGATDVTTAVANQKRPGSGRFCRGGACSRAATRYDQRPRTGRISRRSIVWRHRRQARQQRFDRAALSGCAGRTRRARLFNEFTLRSQDGARHRHSDEQRCQRSVDLEFGPGYARTA